MAKASRGSQANPHDLLIVGAGPAALSAAIYTAREDIETVLYEKAVIGGLAAVTDWVDNYPGFAKGVAGLELSDAMQAQAERFGAKIELGEVQQLSDEGELKKLKIDGAEIFSKAVLIATGSEYKQIGVPGEKEFYGKGVSFCATCDGAFYRDRPLVVVGGGNSAAQETIFLTKFASRIDMLVRSDKMRASDVLQKELAAHRDKVTIHYNTSTDEIIGNPPAGGGKVVKVIGTDKTSGKKVEFACDGVFVFVGLIPNTQFLSSTGIDLDERGFVKTDLHLMTNIPGVFAAGDVRSGATLQIASASGEGATAALMIREYLEEVTRIPEPKMASV